ncbi:hypothetical protein FRC11_007622, partial [Ceratobasidium sp. 423]
MLENTKTSNEEVIHPDLPEDDSHGTNDIDDDLGYELSEDGDWTFVGGVIEYTYVIDLDNLVFTVNGSTHLKLDNMPPSEPGLEAYFEDEDSVEVPPQYISTAVNLWPGPGFDIEERQRQYEALSPIVTPTAEWGALPWDRLSIPQRFSIDLIHHLLSKTSRAMAYAYAPGVREKTGTFCWNILCAATSSVPLCCDNIGTRRGVYNKTLSTKSPTGRYRFRPYEMVHETGAETFKLSEHGYDGHYCWVRDRLITFCIRLNDPAFVAHEVEQMVQKMRRDGHTE